MMKNNGFSQIAKLMVEDKSEAGRNLRDLVRTEMTSFVNESIFRRNLSVNGSNGWGSMKITRQWASRYGMPDWLAGFSNSSVLMVFKGLKQSGTNTPSHNVSGQVMNGVDLASRSSKTDVAAHFEELIPFSLRRLASISGAGVLHHSLTKLIESDPSIKSHYDAIDAKIDARDDLVNKASRTIPKREGEEFDSKVLARFREVDQITKRISSRADKLESLIAQNSEMMSFEEMEIIQDFMEKVKAGMVSNRFS